MDLISQHYLHGGGNSQKPPDVMPGDVILVAVQEPRLIKQTVHSQVDVGAVHQRPAFSYDLATVEGVMHDHQDYWFILCEYNTIRMSEKSR